MIECKPHRLLSLLNLTILHPISQNHAWLCDLRPKSSFLNSDLDFLNSILLIIYSPLFEINIYTVQLFVLTYFSLLAGLVMQLSVVASVAVSLSVSQSAAMSVAVLTALTWALRCTVSLLCKITLVTLLTVSPSHCFALLAGLHSGRLAVSLLSGVSDAF